MSTTNQILSKADAVLEVIFSHDQEMPSCQHKFSDIMEEIITMWRNNSEKVSKVEVFPSPDLTTAPKDAVNLGG
jgi:hypothetical protein